MVLGQFVGDGDVPVAGSVDALHLLTEEAAVGRGIAEVVDGNVIVDHLMEDGILDERFRQVDAGVDTENEVLMAYGSKEPCTMLNKGYFAEEGAGVRQFDRDRRKGTGKETGVVGVKARLYVRDRGDHCGCKGTKNI